MVHASLWKYQPQESLPKFTKFDAKLICDEINFKYLDSAVSMKKNSIQMGESSVFHVCL